MGFEALYWLPWLAKVRRDNQIPPDRLIPFSRGGAAQWYGTHVGLELYAMRSPTDVRIAQRLYQQKFRMNKQTTISAFDKALVADARQTLGYGRKMHVLHPHWMYRDLYPFFTNERGLGWLSHKIDFGTLPAPPLPDGITLPDDFVAVRFYTRYTWPRTDETNNFAHAVISTLAKSIPVVVFDDGPQDVDDHLDVRPAKGLANVYPLSQIAPHLTLETNLLVQSAILARARCFVGTYGGFAQLALRFGKPVVSFYREWGGTSWAHRQLSEILAAQLNIPWHCLPLGHIPFMQDVIPRVMMSEPPKKADEKSLDPIGKGA